MKLFLDENLSTQHAAELRAHGHDAVAVVEAGLAGATDEQVLRFAVENERVLVTLDADFANVMRFPPEGTCGVVRLKVHPPTEDRILQTIYRALVFLKDLNVNGRLVVIDEDKVRIPRISLFRRNQCPNFCRVIAAGCAPTALR